MNARLEIQNHRSRFDEHLRSLAPLVAERRVEEAIQAAHDAATYAAQHSCGLFVSEVLEQQLAQIGQLIPDAQAVDPTRQTGRRHVVTVMSGAYGIGGHSRIAWRWIELDTASDHTLVLTLQGGSPVPDQLQALERAGRLRTVVLDAAGWVPRVQALRQVLATADVVVLLTHPNEVITSAALPGMARKPPVVFMDHASHSFWTGASVSNLVLSMSGQQLEDRRGIPAPHIGWAPLPMDFTRLDQAPVCDVRAGLGLPAGATLLLSSGSDFKFWPIEGISLDRLVDPVLAQNPSAHLLVVGVKPTAAWQALSARFPGRVHLKGYLPEAELVACYHACDIYLDALPLGSPTAMFEASACGKPVVRFAPPDWRKSTFSIEIDTIPTALYIWTTPEQYEKDVNRLIADPAFRQWRGGFGRDAVRLYHANDTFVHAIESAYERVRALPTIAVDVQPTTWYHERLDELLVHLTNNQKRAQGLPGHTRVLAFHLPQFHEIPENNAWWGDGFTEWTNVRQGRPLFEGHAQPLTPTELGYYDLTAPGVLAAQARLAREHGIHGFCFHYYWFDGQRLLERPVDLLLAQPGIDLPFCLCWANENWTRRWDGGEQDVLMHQSYDPALHGRFAQDLAVYFADPRYIRVHGKPVLLVYRTDVIPDLAATTAAWRQAWRELGVGEVYLVAVESFVPIDPEAQGFDAAAEFPPHQVHAASLPPDAPPNVLSDPDARVGDYQRLAHTWLERPRPAYKRFHGLLPGWDNSARRRRGGATLFVNANPDTYGQWLTQAVGRTLDTFEGDERLVFVNAWNEWGEGCTLEPDARWGRGYLEATRKVLQRSEADLRADARRTAPPSAYGRWLAEVATPPGDVLLPPLLAAGAKVTLAVAVSGGGAGGVAATQGALATQLRAPDAVTWAPSGGAVPLGDWALSACEWTVCVCAGDTLTPDALAHLARALATAPASALLAYADHGERGADGALGAPSLKPAFNHELLLSCAYMGRALVVRTAWLRTCLSGDPSERFDLPWAYRLALVTLREGGAAAFVHVPVLAWHLTTAEPAVFAQASTAWQAMAAALQAHAQLAEPGSEVLEGPLPGSFHLLPPLPRTPLVSIIVPTRDQLPFLSRCIESLLAKTAYPAFELLVVDNDSQTPEARDFLQGLATVMPDRIRVLSAPGPFNFSRMNNLAVQAARGEFVLLLNNDTAVLQADWLGHMVRQGLRPGVGVVGARLLFPDGRLQHAGVVVGLCGPADHPLLGQPNDQPGYMGRGQLTQAFSAVTAACLLIPTALYQAVGGLDEATFGVSYNDVDLCLRVGALGHRVVWTPLATLLHEGSASQRAAVEDKTQAQKAARFGAEQAAFYARWPQQVAQDPHHSPHLSLSDRDYGLETRRVLRPEPLRGLAPNHIAVFAADDAGCGQYRVLQPLAAMRAAGLCTGAPSPELLDTHLLLRTGAQVAVFQRPYTDVGLAALRAAKAVPGLRTVYDIDDHMAAVPVKSLHHGDVPTDIQRRILQGVGLCDRLVVSTEPLAAVFRAHAADVRVVPNRLPPALWGDTPPTRPVALARRKPRIGWAGGAGHAGDLAMVADVVRELADEVEWVFFGMCPPALRPYMRAYHAGVPTLRYPQQLMQVTQSWDLAIAPLEANAFNACKSHLKLLEYGWCGVPVVCSDVAPYQGDWQATRVRNRHRDWVNALRERIADLPAAQAEGDALQRQVATQWVLRGDGLDAWHRAWTH